MAFGKRTTDKHLEAPSSESLDRSAAPPRVMMDSLDRAKLSRLLVISVAGVVMLGAISALFVMQPGRGEPVEVEASLIDGSQVSASAQGRVVQMCVEEGLMSATRGDETGDQHSPRVARACECTVSGVVGQLSPLQMQMVYVDYRTKLRATIAQVDRTGERVSIGDMPRIDARDGAPVALITAASYAAHWREARELVSQQAARCQS